ncbi:MAG: hypothetical protein DRP84_07465 [Spirochaetes bacterium]|nr:MAG: hypothetical protein DRP84_07465 [Spirochaetota bacterium]
MMKESEIRLLEKFWEEKLEEAKKDPDRKIEGFGVTLVNGEIITEHMIEAKLEILREILHG